MADAPKVDVRRLRIGSKLLVEVTKGNVCRAIVAQDSRKGARQVEIEVYQRGKSPAPVEKSEADETDKADKAKKKGPRKPAKGEKGWLGRMKLDPATVVKVIRY